MFLLFLDCTWQLQYQFPSSFEFTEIYLTSVWDSVTLGLFHNFVHAGIPRKTTPLNVWNWENQFDDDDIELFRNPLYAARTYLNKVHPSGAKGGASTDCRPVSSADILMMKNKRPMPTNKPTSTWPSAATTAAARGGDVMARSKALRFSCSLTHLRLWSHCYLRWMTPVQIDNGGTPCEYVARMALLSDIVQLQQQIADLESSLAQPKSRISAVPVVPAGWSSPTTAAYETPGSPFTQHVAVARRISSSYPYSPCRPANPTAFFGAQISMMPRISLAEDTMSVDELSLGDVTTVGTAV